MCNENSLVAKRPENRDNGSMPSPKQNVVQWKRGLYELRRDAALRKLTREERKLVMSNYNANATRVIERRLTKLLVGYFEAVNRAIDVVSIDIKKELVDALRDHEQRAFDEKTFPAVPERTTIWSSTARKRKGRGPALPVTV
jgi:hypothetical protein